MAAYFQLFFEGILFLSHNYNMQKYNVLKDKVTHHFFLLWKSYFDCILSILTDINAFTSEWKFISTLKIPILFNSFFKII